MSEQLPTISLAGARQGGKTELQETAAEVDATLSRLGFFLVTDHGVPQGTIDGIINVSREFFARDMEEKLSIASVGMGSHRGYIATGIEALAHTLGENTPPDLKEGFGMGPPRVTRDRQTATGVGPTYRPNRWPVEPPAFKPHVLAYYAEMERLTGTLMLIFEAALGLEPRFFESRFGDHNSSFRIAHYPPLSETPKPGQLRSGAHTDYGALTILLGEDVPGGLEIETPEGEWLPAKAGAYELVVNIGDLMMIWSNDRWRSSPHRVANPPAEAWPGESRISLAYFCNPNDDLEIACLPGCDSTQRPARYASTTAGELRHRKIEAAKSAVVPREAG